MDLVDVLANAKKSTAELQGLLADAQLCALFEIPPTYPDDWEIGDNGYMLTEQGETLPQGCKVKITDIRIKQGQTWLMVRRTRSHAAPVPILASVLSRQNPQFARIRRNSQMCKPKHMQAQGRAIPRRKEKNLER